MAIVILQWLAGVVVPVVVPNAMAFRVLAGLFGGLAIVLWWVFFSRAPWSERLGAVVLMIVTLFATSRIVDKSIATGAMGMLFPVLAIPTLSLAFGLTTRSRATPPNLEHSWCKVHPSNSGRPRGNR